MITTTLKTPAYEELYKPQIDKATALWNIALPNSDDITIDFSFEKLASNVLGQATPDTFSMNLSSSPFLAIYAIPETGHMTFNSDSYTLDTSNSYYSTFFPVVYHEMAHVLGFGTLWNIDLTLFSDFYTYLVLNYPQYAALEYANKVLDTTDRTKFIGRNALAMWRSGIPGHEEDTFVPIENEGGEGSIYSHWDQSNIDYSDYRNRDFKFELMTAGLELQGSTNEIVDVFLSLLTIASLEDIGYSGNRWKASNRFNMIMKGAI
ncbi:MAG: hypothetical protein LBD57_04185 [Endomicrobium sp.]|jgi:hypothetical protein|uniref:hypothetical protein n=1 Tax=Candidatus Endomicrobiellum cubanum TaxID=3242325 RepID=UPI00282491A8|nr:hypothetical protein [Endomicrobium sp.]